MRTLYILFFFICVFANICCSEGSNNQPILPDEEEPTPPPSEFNPDNVGLEYDDGTNIAFHIKIAIDKEGFDMRDMDFFKSRLKTQWEAINERFMKQDKKNVLKRNYIFIPDLEDIIIFEGDHWEVPKNYANRIDKNKYQCIVAYDFVIQEGEGGGGCSDDGYGMSNILVVNPGIEPGKFFNHLDETTSTVAAIVHEFGHFRGIIDLYPFAIKASDNPVSGQSFSPIAGIMNNPYPAIKDCEWSEYELRCLNVNGARKEYRLYDTCLWETFTDFIEFTITENGEPVEGYTLNFYKTESYKVTKQIAHTMSADGNKVRKDAKALFWYGKALWQYYGMFLVEAINTKTGNKGYCFLPIYEPHTQGLIDKVENKITDKSFYKKTIDIQPQKQ